MQPEFQTFTQKIYRTCIKIHLAVQLLKVTLNSRPFHCNRPVVFNQVTQAQHTMGARFDHQGVQIHLINKTENSSPCHT